MSEKHKCWGNISSYDSKCIHTGTLMAIQRLRLCLSMQGVWVQALVGELGSHMPHGQKAKA